MDLLHKQLKIQELPKLSELQNLIQFTVIYQKIDYGRKNHKNKSQKSYRLLTFVKICPLSFIFQNVAGLTFQRSAQGFER